MENSKLNLKYLVDLNQTICKDLLFDVEYPWEAIPNIKNYIAELVKILPNTFNEIKKDVWVCEDAEIEPSSMIKGPAIICSNCQIRHGAYIRENVIIGENVTIGNSTEVKNSIIFNDVQIPHFNYVGDSILGHKSHLGAGVIISNVKSIKGSIKIKISDNSYIDSGLRKFGSILGDYTEIGCNVVLNPGTIIGKNSVVYPLVSVRGVIENDSIVKNSEIIKRDCNKS